MSICIKKYILNLTKDKKVKGTNKAETLNSNKNNLLVYMYIILFFVVLAKLSFKMAIVYFQILRWEMWYVYVLNNCNTWVGVELTAPIPSTVYKHKAAIFIIT